MSRPNAAGNVHAYELCVIFDGGLDEKKAQTLLDKYLEVITNEGGSIGKIDPWGRKPFAYEINKKTEGIYFVVEFNATSATSDEFQRRLNLDEATVRFKVFRGDK
jgi:small subunit ribosomal protein S6